VQSDVEVLRHAATLMRGSWPETALRVECIADAREIGAEGLAASHVAELRVAEAANILYNTLFPESFSDVVPPFYHKAAAVLLDAIDQGVV